MSTGDAVTTVGMATEPRPISEAPLTTTVLVVDTGVIGVGSVGKLKPTSDWSDCSICRVTGVWRGGGRGTNSERGEHSIGKDLRCKVTFKIPSHKGS